MIPTIKLPDEKGPFDIFGDIHGCYDELRILLGRLGYEVADASENYTGKLSNTNLTAEPLDAHVSVKCPAGRKAIFLGDLVDRGPKVPQVLKLVMSMVAAGDAFCLPGNHDVKLAKKLNGRNVMVAHGLAETLEQLEQESDAFKNSVALFIDGLASHIILDDGKLVVAHAGMKEALQGQDTDRVRSFALYGQTTGKTDEYGLPVRADWARDYRGKRMVVYGHTPVANSEWINGTINIDNGCVFGGKLTALRYPEKELVSVPAAKTYWQSPKPLV